MKVSELIEALETAAASNLLVLNDEQRGSLRLLVEALAPHKEVQVASLAKKVSKAAISDPKPRAIRKSPTAGGTKQRKPRPTKEQIAAAIALYTTQVRSAFYDDADFREVAARLKDDGAMNKDAVVQLIRNLFGELSFDTSTIRKPSAIQKLRDLRNTQAIRDARRGADE